jgi:hypothetical protein
LEKKITMDCDEAIEYIKNNVKEYDILELSYNRVYTPGEVLGIEACEIKGRKSCCVMISVAEETVSTSVEIDLEEIKDDLIEVIHIPRDKEEKTIIMIEKCDV